MRTKVPFFISCLIVFVFSCCKPKPEFRTGALELNIRPTVSGQSFESLNTYQNIQGRSYRIDNFLMYVSDIYIVHEDGKEELLSEIELFDFVVGGSSKRVAHGAGAFSIFKLPAGDYKGIKFGIGVPDRLNTRPSDHPDINSLNAAHGTFISSKQGYAYVSIDGKIDMSPDANGQNLDLSLTYRIGKDSLGSPNDLYKSLTYIEPRHAFSVEEGRELQFIIELDFNRLFYNRSDTLDMVAFPSLHSSSQEEFELAKGIMDNLATRALFKVPF